MMFRFSFILLQFVLIMFKLFQLSSASSIKTALSRNVFLQHLTIKIISILLSLQVNAQG